MYFFVFHIFLNGRVGKRNSEASLCKDVGELKKGFPSLPVALPGLEVAIFSMSRYTTLMYTHVCVCVADSLCSMTNERGLAG